MLSGESQYLELAQTVLDEGDWVYNTRTGKWTVVSIGHSMRYDCSEGDLPLITTRKTNWKGAVAEMLGYIRGYNNAADFRKIGCNTWNANANENEAWLNNRHRKGDDDMGYCYGAVGSEFRRPDGSRHNQWDKVIYNLTKGVDDRREIVTFWHPGTLDEACLAPCMHTHTFSLVNGGLYLTSSQRSIDIPLGLTFNMIQVAWLLMVVARVTGNKAMTAKHDLVNCHIYSDQADLMRYEQLTRGQFAPPKLSINPLIKTWDDLMTWVTVDDFNVTGYRHHEAIKYPFSV
jgi:thymidylate synthase